MLQSNVCQDSGSRTATKERILEAAEHLFAELGFEATSLRKITTAAGVNLAAVNYHFRSKDDLIRAVFARRIGPLNRRRLEQLNSHLSSAGDGPVSLEAIIKAFVEPVVQLKKDPRSADTGKLFGRTYADPSGVARRALFDQMKEIARPFTDAFRRALPELGQVDLLYKMHFSVGVMAHTLAGTEHMKMISGGLCDPTDTEEILGRMVDYIAAGMRAGIASRAARS